MIRRVRAGAGKASFRREKTRCPCLAEAEARVAAWRETSDQGGTSSRSDAAKARAAEDREARWTEASANRDERRTADEGRQSDTRNDPAELRAATTDPEARKRTMADGGFRPASNVPFATTTAVGVAVTREGCDNNRLVPLIEPSQGK